MKKLLLPIFAFASTALFSQANFVELPVDCDPTWTNFDIVESPNAQTIWGAGISFVGTTNVATQGITYSNDAGQTWSNSVIPTPTAAWRFASLEAYNSQLAWATFYNGTAKGKVYKTTDAGANWTDKTPAGMYSGSVAFANWTHFYDELEGITMGDPTGPSGTATGAYFEIWKTTDGGDNWARIPKASLPAIITGEFGLTDGYEAVGDRLWFVTNKGRCVYSNDRGVTWLVSQTDFDYFFKMAMRDGDHGTGRILPATTAAALNVSPIIKTSDGGATWTAAEDANLINGTDLIPYTIYDMDYIPGTHTLVSVGTVANQSGAYITAFSVDDGIIWHVIDADVYRSTVTMVNESTGYFGGSLAGLAAMYSYSDVVLPDNEPKFERFDIRAFPNPANQILEITSSLTQSTDLWVTITNSSGQIVRRELWKNNGSSFNGRINTGGIPGGIYSIHLSNGSSSVFQKIVIVH